MLGLRILEKLEILRSDGHVNFPETGDEPVISLDQRYDNAHDT